MELQSSLVFTNDYICFIKGYTKVACPLYDQISGDNAAHEKKKISEWRNAKKPLICWKVMQNPAMILAFADFTKQFKLHTDTSTIGLGTILYQEQGGKDWVIGYASRTLPRSESYYPAHKLEFVALKWPVTESFQEYLYGNTFASYSDNNPLTCVLTTAPSLMPLDRGGLPSWPNSILQFITIQVNPM